MTAKKHPKSPNPKKKSSQNPLAIVGTTLLVLVCAQLALLGINYAHASSPVFGLRFQNVPVGTTFSPQLGDYFTKTIIEKANTQPITLKVGSSSQKVSPKDLGLLFNSDGTQAKLISDGRTGSLVEQIIYQDAAYFGLKNEKLTVNNIDVTAAQEYVDQMASSFGQARKNANFGFKDGKIIILADQSGLSLENTEALQGLQATLTNYHQIIVLPVKTQGADITVGDLKPLLGEAQQITSNPLSVSAANQKVSLSPDQILALTTVQKTEKDKKAQITFSTDKVNALINELSSKVNVAARPEISDGTDVLDPGKDGQALDLRSASNSIISNLDQRKTNAENIPEAITLAVYPVKRGLVIQKPKTVNITFDDAPGQATNQILDELKAAGVHATFFLIGGNVVGDPVTARRIVAEGNTIGNHTYDHIDLRTLPADQIRSEITRAQDTIVTATGVTPKIFRAPYTFYNDTVKSVVASLGLQPVLFTVDPNDWKNPGINVITSRVVNGVTPGGIVIMHVGQQTADALPEIIKELKAKGYKFIN